MARPAFVVCHTGYFHKPKLEVVGISTCCCLCLFILENSCDPLWHITFMLLVVNISTTSGGRMGALQQVACTGTQTMCFVPGG